MINLRLTWKHAWTVIKVNESTRSSQQPPSLRPPISRGELLHFHENDIRRWGG